jgi:hypothetical protein
LISGISLAIAGTDDVYEDQPVAECCTMPAPHPLHAEVVVVRDHLHVHPDLVQLPQYGLLAEWLFGAHLPAGVVVRDNWSNW